jgi:hypothetical protein
MCIGRQRATAPTGRPVLYEVQTHVIVRLNSLPFNKGLGQRLGLHEGHGRERHAARDVAHRREPGVGGAAGILVHLSTNCKGFWRERLI